MSEDEYSVRRYAASRRLKPETRAAYELVLGYYVTWLDGEGVGVLDATTHDVKRFIDEYSVGRKPSTVYNVFKHINRYYWWLQGEGAIARSPAVPLREQFIDHRTPPHPVTVADLRALLGAAGSDRNWSLIAMLAFNSLSVSSLLACDITDLDHDGTHTRLNVRAMVTPRRVQYVVIPNEVEVVLRRQCEGRTSGPLFVSRDDERLSRASAREQIKRIAKRAGIQYEVNARMLDAALPSLATQLGFSFRSVVRATGIPERRHSERWLGPINLSGEDNASVRLSRLVLNEPDHADTYLMHVEALAYASDVPDAFVVMTAGAVLEKHLYELCLAHGLEVPADRKDGKINVYLHELRRNGPFTLGDLRLVEWIATDRNNAAHGAFDLLAPNSGLRVLRNVRELIAKHPLPSGGNS